MSAKTSAVVTTLGTDRPGIVEALSGWILDCGGNIEDSRMALLGGEFATLVKVSGPADLVKRLEDARVEFQKEQDLTVFVKEVRQSPPRPEQPVLRYLLRVTALDHAGIVNQLAKVLRESRANIVSATTSTTSAPFSGAPVFQVKMEVDIPADAPMSRLRAALQDLGDRQNIDFTLRSAEAQTAD